MYKYSGPCNGFVTTLRGQTVTMTGRVVVRGEHIKRDNLAKIIETKGAKFKNDLTGQISLLIHGDLTGQIVANMKIQFSDKLLDVINQDRRKHHVCVVSSAGFSELLNGGTTRCLHDAVAERASAN
ncbi:hypothetical protein [Arthrobacter sp. ES3-54]|uniref:hypothetical protein n=1 Tax=Arthrobacter sp. ES3-54 TaxID=1502991 RepID=UPI0024050965|nr:hypothetical protein [Arthrobacter sp. ES3-54]MDF9751546.1 CheY-specific phosphatase CheX [Arthrobacter sp. ES3-54]